MSLAPIHPDLSRWLEMATKGFPAEAQQRICEEIEDHYLSAASFYQEEGQSAAEAQHNAILELGDVQVARRAFRDTYVSQRQYLLTGILSMIMPLVFAVLFREEPARLLGEGVMTARLIGIFSLLQPLLLVLPILTIVYAGYGLLTNRFHFRPGRWYIGLLIAGLLLAFLPDYLSGIGLIVTGHPFSIGMYVPGASNVQRLVGATGVFIFSSCLMLMSYRLSKLRHSLYGMQPALIVSSWLWGLTQACLAFARITQRTIPFTILLVVSSTAFCTFLGWMFIKAAFKGKLPFPMPGT
jgi:hypothetical protein